MRILSSDLLLIHLSTLEPSRTRGESAFRSLLTRIHPHAIKPESLRKAAQSRHVPPWSPDRSPGSPPIPAKASRSERRRGTIVVGA
ncbi:hypothetical protein HMPREF0043_01412 [Actinobaculum sp. oral taxon 183 str. F0552]|nr:hypothetical protein HMPREF0043_01412 [Actinobaculum sp. oral taxon 183 str. F0552]